ncbi:hypothetical protein G7K_4492-t1 [Saitoella complicata NRRL Y-17804]|uniref:Uncharacterized protein n=1 Tax=Saitoella complicata (strain BCRC 22490 / CBS 7301 / JCM 7358 / NBRC 10748 / NRRL Y-17804) TaxID=698492 RepID=A0A0E9NLU5_SAICN|nr:hypothetical protein G7K_4492-t1 [Saitoella complicata NRRL Y-17804]
MLESLPPRAPLKNTDDGSTKEREDGTLDPSLTWCCISSVRRVYDQLTSEMRTLGNSYGNRNIRESNGNSDDKPNA